MLQTSSSPVLHICNQDAKRAMPCDGKYCAKNSGLDQPPDLSAKFVVGHVLACLSPFSMHKGSQRQHFQSCDLAEEL